MTTVLTCAVVVFCSISIFQEVRRRKLAASLSRTNGQLQRLKERHVDSLQLVSGLVAHETNNVMQVVSQCYSLLQTRLGQYLNESDESLLDAVDEAVFHSTRMTEQLMTYAGCQEVNPEIIQADEFFRSSESLFKWAVGEKTRLAISHEGPQASFKMDRGQLVHAIVNILSNSRAVISGNDRDGTISLTTFEMKYQQPTNKVDNSWRLDNGKYVVIEVTDNGPGIIQKNLDRVFEPFYHGRTADHTSGMGLPTVQGIVRKFGGDVSIESSPGKGTCVRLAIPKVNSNFKTDSPSSPKGKTTLRELPKSSLRCVVVDENASVRDTITLAIEMQGHEVASCASADSALRLLSERGPYDVVITDIRMPGVFSGLELAEWIRLHQPCTAVVVMKDRSNRSPQDDNHLVLCKPFSNEKLREALHLAANHADV